MPKIPASEARLQSAEVVNKLEDRMDLETARKTLREKSPRVAWKKLKAELGLTD